ncbi:MAG: DUF2510 domain-containing protein [Solirubrobacterales bacterium]
MSNGAEIPPGEAQPAVPAGWYPHPTAPGWEAYWDGAAWGTETRPAQAAAVPAGQPAQTAAEPAQAAGAEQYAQAAAAEPAQAAGAEQYAQAAAAGPAQAAGTEQYAQAATPAAAGAVSAAAVPAASRAEARSDSSLPAVICILGAVVAIVGAFLPMGSSDIVDLADNTMVAQTYGLAVIAAAAIGAVVAAIAYVKASRTWLLVLLGVVVIAIAAYAGLAGVDDLEATGLPNLPSIGGTGGQTPDPKALEEIARAAESGSAEPSPATGVFVTGAGGLLMLLGGLGLMRGPR